jgi:rhodanese-related sulfurtransferase
MASRAAILCMAIIIGAILYVVYTNMNSLQQPSLEMPVEEARSKRFRLVIDVRTPKEREELGYYPNSIPIEVDKLQSDVSFLIGSGLQSLQSPILIYCNSGHRAQLAAGMLYQLGYSNVRYISTSYLSLMPGSR